MPKIEENTIKIGHFRYKCRYSTFIITEEGYRHRVWKDSIKIFAKLTVVKEKYLLVWKMD